MVTLLSWWSSRVSRLLTVSLMTIIYPDPTHSIAAAICSSKDRPPGRTCTSGKPCLFISSLYLYHSGGPPGEAGRGDTKTLTLSMGTPSLRSNDNVVPHNAVGRSNDGMTSLKSTSTVPDGSKLSRQCLTVPLVASCAVMNSIRRRKRKSETAVAVTLTGV